MAYGDDDNTQGQATPPPNPVVPTQFKTGGFAGLVQRALPIIQSVGGGLAAAAGNPLPAELVMRQRQQEFEDQRQLEAQQQAESERQLRMSDLGLDIQRKKEDLRVNPPRSPQELMNQNLDFQKQLAQIKADSERPQTFMTQDGRMFYQPKPGAPANTVAAPVMVPHAAPTNMSELSPGAQGPVSPQQSADFLKTAPPEQAIGVAKGSLTPEDLFKAQQAEDLRRQQDADSFAREMAVAGVRAGAQEKNQQGEWNYIGDAKDGSGNIIQQNKQGELRSVAPPSGGVLTKGGQAKIEAANQKDLAPVVEAEEYAKTYADELSQGIKPTGPEDESLMEKYFSVAKPSTGFRMTQPQIDMLNNARSWKGAISAHIQHAMTGTYYTDEQRQQIFHAIKELGEAKRASVTPGQSATSDRSQIIQEIPQGANQRQLLNGVMYWVNSKTKQVYGRAPDKP